MERLTERHRSGSKWIVRTDVPGRNVGDVPHNGCDLKYQYYSGKIINRLGELEDLNTPKQVKESTVYHSYVYQCSECDSVLRINQAYCDECGQALAWSD